MTRVLRFSSLIFVSVLLFNNVVYAQSDYGRICGFTDENGRDKKISCGETYQMRNPSDGRMYNCYCDCSGTNPTLRVTAVGNNQQSTVAQEPSAAELKAYYDREWSNQLNVYGNDEFKKGLKAYKEGDCKKAAKHFKKATSYADERIYTQYLNLANECIGKENLAVTPNPVTPPAPKPNVQNAPPVNDQNISAEEAARRKTIEDLEKEKMKASAAARQEARGISTTPPAVNADSLLKSEQMSMERNTQTWVEYQKEQFKLRIEQPNQWCQNYVNDLQQQIDQAKENEPWNPMKPKTINDLKPGDVILVEGTAIAVADGIFTGTMKTNAAHTLTYLKEVKGVKLFLDNQPGIGPVIISEEQVRKRYDGRGTEIARMTGAPLNEAEVKLLWSKAIELQQKNNIEVKDALFSVTYDGIKYYSGTEYGVVGDNMVCSKASWELLKATGREDFNPEGKGWVHGWYKKTIFGFSPADFYENNQYFLISRLKL